MYGSFQELEVSAYWKLMEYAREGVTLSEYMGKLRGKDQNTDLKLF